MVIANGWIALQVDKTASMAKYDYELDQNCSTHWSATKKSSQLSVILGWLFDQYFFANWYVIPLFWMFQKFLFVIIMFASVPPPPPKKKYIYIFGGVKLCIILFQGCRNVQNSSITIIITLYRGVIWDKRLIEAGSWINARSLACSTKSNVMVFHSGHVKVKVLCLPWTALRPSQGRPCLEAGSKIYEGLAQHLNEAGLYSEEASVRGSKVQTLGASKSTYNTQLRWLQSRTGCRLVAHSIGCVILSQTRIKKLHSWCTQKNHLVIPGVHDTQYLKDSEPVS